MPNTSHSSSPAGPSSGVSPSRISARPASKALLRTRRLPLLRVTNQPPTRAAATASPAMASTGPCWSCTTTASGMNTSRQPKTKGAGRLNHGGLLR